MQWPAPTAKTSLQNKGPETRAACTWAWTENMDYGGTAWEEKQGKGSLAKREAGTSPWALELITIGLYGEITQNLPRVKGPQRGTRTSLVSPVE